MGALASLGTPALAVEPGSATESTLAIRNTGQVVDQFTFEVLGPAGAWTRVEPPSVSLFPGADGSVQVVAAPPRDPSVAAGVMPFAVRVISAEDPGGSVVEEGTIDVAPFSDVTVELVPRASRGRRSAALQLGVDNRSNVAFRAELSGLDAELGLGFAFRPPLVDVPPGNVAFSKVRVKPHRRFWRGTPRTHPFQVVLTQLTATGWGPHDGGEPAGPGGAPGPAPTPGYPPPPGYGAPGGPPGYGPPGVPGPPPVGYGGTPGYGPGPAGVPTGQLPTVSAAEVHPPQIPADGTFLQEPMLPGWILKALAAVLALVLIAAILWFSLVKPQIKSAAQNQVSKQLSAAGITTTTTVPGSTSGAGGSKSGGSGGGSGSGGGGGSGSGSSGSSGPNPDFSQTLSGNGSSGLFSYTVPNGLTLSITDLLVENAGGLTGTMALERNSSVMMEWSMADFRDLDYHWITPMVFTSGQQVNLQVTCNGTCAPAPAIYFAGSLK